MSAELKQVTHIDNVRLGEDEKSVVIIDQTQLPNRTEYLTLRTAEEMYDAIKLLQVRGAPAIGICAAYSIYALARQWEVQDSAAFAEKFHSQKEYLNSSRPTAVNLSWALNRMEGVVSANAGKPVAEILDSLGKECRAIHEEDIAMCRAISEHGLSLIKEGDGILTHCNAGPLATSRYGTALGPLFLGKERGMNFRVFSDETRPLLQGARLTSYELQKAGIDVTLICDNMASIVMAILAKHYGIPFYVLGPTSTIDLNCPDGDHIPIELRDPDEIREKWYAEPMALPEVKCYNPAFDVTDHTLIAGIVTEKGICRAPYTESLAALFDEKH